MLKTISFAMFLTAVPALAAELAPAPTFAKDIAPIIFNNCSACHHAGEVAPFTLTSYEDVRKRASRSPRSPIRGVMPPWKAELGFGDFIG